MRAFPQYGDRPAGTLSGGNKRKLSLAIALVGDPSLIVLDEMSTGVDPQVRRYMWDVLLGVVNERSNTAVILTSHNLEGVYCACTEGNFVCILLTSAAVISAEVEALCSRIGIMVGGRLRALGPIQHLKNRFGSGYTFDVRVEPPSPADLASIEAAMSRALSPVRTSGGSNTDPCKDGVSRSELEFLCRALGKPHREAELTEAGTGWALAATLARLGDLVGVVDEPRVPLVDFAQWWAEEVSIELSLSLSCSLSPAPLYANCAPRPCHRITPKRW